MFLDKTLEELDGVDWGEPTYQSNLVIECHRVRRIPLKDFTDEDLRRLIGQKFSLDYVVPLALMRLMDEPFAGDWYSGDILSNLLSLPKVFWEGHPELAQSLELIVGKATDQLAAVEDLHAEVPDCVIEQLRKHSVGAT